MGNPRPKPKNLGRKLRQIRESLDIKQPYMPARLGLFGMHPGRISEYENGVREPNAMTLLAYADLAGVHLEDIVNDNVELPQKLPGKIRHNVVPR